MLLYLNVSGVAKEMAEILNFIPKSLTNQIQPNIIKTFLQICDFLRRRARQGKESKSKKVVEIRPDLEYF